MREYRENDNINNDVIRKYMKLSIEELDELIKEKEKQIRGEREEPMVKIISQKHLGKYAVKKPYWDNIYFLD